MHRIAMVILAALAATGCAGFGGVGGLLSDAGDAGYARVAGVVDEYCALPEDRRRLIRGRVNDRTGASVLIHCPGEPLPGGATP